MKTFNPFHNKVTDVVIYEQIKKEIREARNKIYEKYKDRLRDIKEKEDGMVGFEAFEIEKESLEIIKKDPVLSEMYRNVSTQRIATRKMVKQAFKECINEILDEITVVDVNGEKTNPKTNRMLLAEKLVRDTLNGTIEPNVLKGFEVIRDTIGEKPVSEIISKGIQQKVIDVKITKEKVDKVKNILEGLRRAKVTDGLGKNIAIRTVDAGFGDEGTVETDLSGESERVYNSDVLPDKQD